MAALGFARYDTQEKKLHSREELFDKMCMALAGRAAELYKFDRATTGAQDDLKKVRIFMSLSVCHRQSRVVYSCLPFYRCPFVSLAGR